MKKTNRRKGRKNLRDEIDWFAEQINSILENKEKERYFEGIVLVYTLIDESYGLFDIGTGKKIFNLKRVHKGLQFSLLLKFLVN